MDDTKKTPEVWEYVLGTKFTGSDYKTALTKEQFLVGGRTVEEIRAKYLHYGETKNLNRNTAVLDIRLLLEVIDRLVKDRK